MKYITLFIVLFLFSCNSFKITNKDYKENKTYLIKNIDSINDWNIIYAMKQDSLYKIVVKKNNYEPKNCQKITIGKFYNLVLHSRKKNVPTINGVKIRPVNNIDIQCYSYDEDTNICIEIDNGIYDLYYTDNIKGLCYKKKP